MAKDYVLEKRKFVIAGTAICISCLHCSYLHDAAFLFADIYG